MGRSTADAEAEAIAIYKAHAGDLVPRYDAVAAKDVLAPVMAFLPTAATKVLDVGAGSGRDLAWLAGQGHGVTAAEPVAGFRAAIARRMPAATVIDARLPDLSAVEGPFGLILANAVWHHLTGGSRRAAIARLAGLLEPAGRLILSLRHGPLPAGQPLHPLDAEEEIARAGKVGLLPMFCAAAPSHQGQNIASGVTWTWLVFEKEAL